MPKKSHMTWVPAGKRWMKKSQGKMYSVSCRQLNCPETREGSIDAANAWWEAKKTEIATMPPTEEEVRANAFKVWMMVQDWHQLDEASREKLVDSMIGVGKYQKIKGQADSLVAEKPAPADRSIGVQIENWEEFLRKICKSGQMSEGRFDSYCRAVGIFRNWIGETNPVDVIDEAKLEAYFCHLTVLVDGKLYSTAYAHTILMTAKQFISRLAELKLIPLPGNIRSRRMRFNHSAPKTIETFSPAEVRDILAACDDRSERLKLYVLLMLNCGMYQNDIAELRKDEVNWTKGTLTRARSKTRERNGPVVTYALWPETFALLKKHKAVAGDIALTTENGNPLVKFSLGEDGAMQRYDCIHAAWRGMAGSKDKKSVRLPMKHLRKTSATLLGSHPQFKFFALHFLADSPRGVADRHYVKPSDEEFALALGWLRGQILGTKDGKPAA
ncbi:tyrosine-type recombinase/integrase [Zavarzinella formosa]|uniref:tyrosine-type recombinase/integrase n=1 Tax=Zavarzinella formosa TaxID=360055 RepID=UPI00031BCF6F|nr:tyrosine-type recombinase/integrase [Zavarzinella formosa]